MLNAEYEFSEQSIIRSMFFKICLYGVYIEVILGKFCVVYNVVTHNLNHLVIYRTSFNALFIQNWRYIR